MKTTISVPDMNDCFLRIVILGVEYLIRFTYNDTYDCWSFGLYLPNKEPIAQNIKIVPNLPLNLFTGCRRCCLCASPTLKRSGEMPFWTARLGFAA